MKPSNPHKSFLYKKTDKTTDKTIEETVLNHPVEKRGFVSVPLDYAKPHDESIKIFYRLIPTFGGSAEDTSKPLLVIFNGGPGVPSSAYRPLNFDYTNASNPQNGLFDRFQFISKTHRVLLADQRGTDGLSAPLDLTDPDLDGYSIAKYFSSDAQARDYLAVIKAVIPDGASFSIIAQSYGGMVGIQYLSLPDARIPDAIFFTCSALPYEDVKKASLERRKEQHDLNLELKAAFPEIEKKVIAVRSHLEANGLNPDFIHSFYMWLGKSEKGDWEKKLVDRLDQICRFDQKELENEFKNSIGVGNVLNYILSSANFTPGETDRSIAEFTSREIPFEPWMFNENWTLLQIGKGHPATERVIAEMDRNPPPPTSFLKASEIRKRISRFKVIFVSADNDAFVPAQTFQRSYQKFEVEGHTFIEHLPGGHHAIFLQDGHRALLKWASTH